MCCQASWELCRESEGQKTPRGASTLRLVRRAPPGSSCCRYRRSNPIPARACADEPHEGLNPHPPPRREQAFQEVMRNAGMREPRAAASSGGLPSPPPGADDEPQPTAAPEEQVEAREDEVKEELKDEEDEGATASASFRVSRKSSAAERGKRAHPRHASNAPPARSVRTGPPPTPVTWTAPRAELPHLHHESRGCRLALICDGDLRSVVLPHSGGNRNKAVGVNVGTLDQEGFCGGVQSCCWVSRVLVGALDGEGHIATQQRRMARGLTRMPLAFASIPLDLK